jgi:hypothetical protein
MFEIVRKNKTINRAEYKGYKVDSGISVTPNADIEYYEGYEDDGVFVSCGVNKLHIQNSEEVKDEEGNVTTPAGTEFTDFMAMLDGSFETEASVITYLINKVGE